LNLRPPGYEPGELPDCSTPRREGEYSIARMWLLVASAVVFLVCAAAGGAFVFVRTRELFRHLGAFGGATDEGLARLSASTTRLEEGLRPADFGPSTARLRASRAELAVLLAAVTDVRASLGRITTVVPRK
jgi:uncharacterized membrane protein